MGLVCGRKISATRAGSLRRKVCWRKHGTGQLKTLRRIGARSKGTGRRLSAGWILLRQKNKERRKTGGVRQDMTSVLVRKEYLTANANGERIGRRNCSAGGSSITSISIFVMLSHHGALCRHLWFPPASKCYSIIGHLFSSYTLT
jgi:hypothetical protein